MIRVLLCVVFAFAGEIIAQPLQCKADGHCSTGFFCELDTLFCRECLLCENLKRETPIPATPCVKSVGECGYCIEGYVEDREGDLNSECILLNPSKGGHWSGGTMAPTNAPDDTSHSSGFVWGMVAVGLVMIAILVGIVLYALRNTDPKILASTRASVRSTCVTNGAVNASAPELPPPYYPPYAPVRPNSPSSPEQPEDQHVEERPFIKRAPSEERPSDSRESAGNQEARAFNPPAYIRGAQITKHETDPEPEPPFSPHDEETMESPWTPTDTANNNVTTGESTSNGEVTTVGNTNLSAMLAAARATTLGPSPAKVLCVRKEPNNNRSRSGGSQEGEPSAAPSFTINVVQNINTGQQRNDFSI